MVVEEARTWIGTPYRLGSCLKSGGVDCAQFVAAVYKAVGIIPMQEEVPFFTHDWFAHTYEEHYLRRLLKYTYKSLETKAYRSVKTLPGDLVLTRAAKSKVYNHAGIVVGWPKIIHAISPCVELINASTHPLWSYQLIVVLNPWQKERDDRQDA